MADDDERLAALETALADLGRELRAKDADIRYLKDRVEILDCVARHARGCDRFDNDLLASTYHEDGVDEHGYAINPGPKYPQWADAAHRGGSLQNMHNITTHLVEIEGDVAHAESYVIGLFYNINAKTSRILAGRYADRLERRDGVWRIALRRSTVDVCLEGDASMLTNEHFIQRGFVKGMRDRRDVTYQRPLTLDETPADRW